jgi:glycosyltransferase involved in cell wall biosynthesis
MSKKNILEFCLSPDLGGLELCVVDYFNYLSIQYNCKIIVAPNKKLDHYLSDNPNKSTLKRNKLFPIIPALKLAKFIDNNDIDIVHFHWTRDIATVILAKVISKKKPKIIQSRHMTMTRFKDDFYHKWLYKNISIIHAVTYQVQEQLIRYIPQDVRPDIQMVYLGVDKPDIDSKKVLSLKAQYNLTDQFVIGIVGRIEQGKGQYILIDAIKKLKSLNIKALIVGHTMDSNYLESLKEDIKLHNIQDRIIFTGFTKDVNEHLNLCDVTVLATPKETFGLVVIESMVNHIPVIVTNNGGPLEIVDNNIDGLYFDRTVDDLVSKIQMIYEDTALKNKLKSNCYKKVTQKFNKSKQMEVFKNNIID